MRDTLSLNNAREPPRHELTAAPFETCGRPTTCPQAWDNESFEGSYGRWKGGGAKPLRFDRGDWNEAADDRTPFHPSSIGRNVVKGLGEHGERIAVDLICIGRL